MDSRETARLILDSFSDEQLEAFVKLFEPLIEDNTAFNEELVTVEVELPKWLADKADESGLNLSEVLVKALKKELGVK